MGPGEYLLTLVATRGSDSGVTSSGRLWLADTSPRDSSPRTGEGAKDIRTGAYLLGATDLDFSSIGAPVALTSDTVFFVPRPTSEDPVYPGVLGLFVNWEGWTLPHQTVFVVGTFSNSRKGLDALDGEGIGLWVRRFEPWGFAGTWDAWGMIRDGSGYFCAARIGHRHSGRLR